MARKNNHPSFTVLIPVYFRDKCELFNRAINSIFSNDLIPNDVLLVIDGPIPTNLNASIKLFQKKYKLNVITIKKNVGLAAALNIGLSYVNTEWVFRADSDDYNISNRFSKLMHSIKKNPKLDLIGSGIAEFDEKNKFIANKIPPLSKYEIFRTLEFRSPFNHMSVAYRLSKVVECRGYPSIALREDYALWGIMIKNNARVKNIPDILVRATAGDSMLRRRRGFAILKSEWELHKLFLKLKIRGPFYGMLILILRSLLLLSPLIILKKFYINFLRA